jgi:hypothetical protein
MRRAFFAVFLTLLSTVAFSQQPMTNDEVLKLVKAGMGDDLIVNMINARPGAYSLSADEMIVLKTGGVSDKVMSAMLLKTSGLSASPAPAASSAGPVHEIGVYYNKAGVWTEVEPEVINFKSGGVLKSMATDGIIKGDTNGNIKGAHSKLDLKTPVELLIYAPEGVAATEYQLLLLHSQSNSREFRTVTGGVFHKSGGASRDSIEFEAKKIAARTFAITLSAVKGGEYGLLPPSAGDSTGSSGRLGKLYTFHVIE